MKHLNDDQIIDLLYGAELDVIKYMEDVFTDYHSGRAKMIPKTYLNTDKGDFRAMPAQWEDMSGIKWISVFPDNHRLNLQTIYGTLLLSDSLTGQPIMSMDCAELTAHRTAAVSAVAGKHLTLNTLVRTLTFIGCGKQALTHFRYYRAIFNNIETVKLYDKHRSSAEKLASKIDSDIDVQIFDDVKNACLSADVITTLTPSTEPILTGSDIEHPFLINAIGADAEGKRELGSSIWSSSILIVDDYEQASHSGELQHHQNLPYLLLSDIITKTCAKPQGNTKVFDSTGLAIEDIAIGKLLYEKYYQGN